MKASARAALSGCLLAAVLLAGCAQCPETRVSMDQLVAEHNVNAYQIPRLWARVRMHITFTGEGGKKFSWGSTSPLAFPNGLLLFSKSPDPLGPQDFVLIGRETLAADDLFHLGSSVSEGVYYLWIHLGEDGWAWWGRQKFAGAAGLENTVPIDPNQLLSVLGICQLPQDFSRIPTVIMRMSRDPCAYVLTYLDREPLTGRILSRREIYFDWDDKRPRLPFRVNLFDSEGEQIMVARLKDYRAIETAEPMSPAPVMPTNIEIDWPERGNRMHLILSEMTTEDKWGVAACRFRDPETDELPAGLSPAHVIQVDRALDAGGAIR